jgi:hypothetical protein
MRTRKCFDKCVFVHLIILHTYLRLTLLDCCKKETTLSFDLCACKELAFCVNAGPRRPEVCVHPRVGLAAFKVRR